jgi:hypothetical protein
MPSIINPSKVKINRFIYFIFSNEFPLFIFNHTDAVNGIPVANPLTVPVIPYLLFEPVPKKPRRYFESTSNLFRKYIEPVSEAPDVHWQFPFLRLSLRTDGNNRERRRQVGNPTIRIPLWEKERFLQGYGVTRQRLYPAREDDLLDATEEPFGLPERFPE